MPSEPMTGLLVSDRAEEIKLITLTLRSLYPGCRLEAVYSQAEASEWASRIEWQFILVDELVLPRGEVDTLHDLKRRAPGAAIIVLCERTEAFASLQPVRTGADYHVYKKSPAFVNQLMTVIKEVLEKRELRLQIDLTQSRYFRLVEMATDLVYELDREGRFTFISQNIMRVLGYSPQELIGAHYSTLLDPEDRSSAERQFNERRTGARATAGAGMRVVPKRLGMNLPATIEVHIRAKGLYDLRNQFLGTIGVIRDLTAQKKAERRIQELQEQVSQAERLLDLRKKIAKLVGDLSAPLSNLVEESSRLLSGIRDLQLEHHLERVASAASTASQLGNAFVESTSVEKEPPTSDQAIERSGDGPAAASHQDPQALTPMGAQEREEGVTADRRRTVRIELQLDASLTDAGTRWGGQVQNISPDGLFAVFEGLVPVTLHQPVQLGFVSPGTVLQLRGIARGIREIDRRQVGAKVFPAVGLAIQITDLTHEERLILMSMLDGVRQGSVPMSLTVLLYPAASDDVLVEARAGQAGALQRLSFEHFPPESEEIAFRENRFATRVNFVMPARLQRLNTCTQPHVYEGRTVNVSAGGACLRFLATLELLGSRVTLSIRLTQQAPHPPVQDQYEMTEHPIAAEVVWAVAESAPLPKPDDVRAGTWLRMGVRFLHIEEAAERAVRQLVAGLMTSPLRIEDAERAPKLISTLIEYPNQKGLRVAVSYDRPRKPLPPGSPLAIIAPGFGETKREYVSLACGLATNGFHVLRYDHTNHVGESQGEMTNTTLTGMKRDLLAILGFAGHTWPASPIVVIAPGLTSRVALKALRPPVKANLLILLTGIFDLRTTVNAVHAEDIIGTHQEKPRKGIINVLGWNVDAERWLGDATREEFADLGSTLKDAERITVPTVLFAAEQDPWTPAPSVAELQAAMGATAQQTYLLPDAGYRLHEDPQKDRMVYRRIIGECVEHCYPATSRENIRDPSARDVNRQRLIERERARARLCTSVRRPLALWDEEFEVSHRSVGSSDYWRFLDDIYQLMGRPNDGEWVLDAACGSGHLGMALLINEAYRQKHTRSPEGHAPCYLGIEPNPRSATCTKQLVQSLEADLVESIMSAVRSKMLVHTAFSLSDLRRPLPFHDSSFERVVCNLAIAHVPDPLSTVRELTRVLAPSGKLILTCFRPYSDLTQLYRNLLASEDTEDKEHAKRLLHHVGTILEAHRNGLFRFFDRQELLSLISSAGAIKPRLYNSLANQAYIAVAEKAV